MKAKAETLNELKTRKQYITLARKLGCEKELRQTFDKFDRMLKETPDALERRQIAVLANVEVYRLLNFCDGLQVGGAAVLPPDPDYKPE